MNLGYYIIDSLTHFSHHTGIMSQVRWADNTGLGSVGTKAHQEGMASTVSTAHETNLGLQFSWPVI